MDDQKPENRMRFTTKAGIGLIAALVGLPQLKAAKDFVLGDQVVTNERIERSMNEGFSRLEQKIERNFDSEVTVHQRLRDLDREDLNSLEARCEKRSDKLESRVSNLEEKTNGKSRQTKEN